jgi:hypothetical protein
MVLLLLTTLDVVVVAAAAGSPSSAHTISSSSSCGFSFTQCRPRGQQQPMSPTHRRRKMESSWHHHRNIMSGPNSPSLLRTKSLRDIMDDSNNVNFDDLQDQLQQQLLGQEQKHQRLTRQLSNLSTQEIKRELEHVHGFGVSTLALLRGKSSLVEALVNARLQREDEEDVVMNNEELLDVKNGDVSRTGSRNGSDGSAVAVIPGVGNVVARTSATSNSSDNVVTVIPGVGNVIGNSRNAASSADATVWNYSTNLESNTIGTNNINNNIDGDGSGNGAIHSNGRGESKGTIAANDTDNISEASTAESSQSDSDSSNWYSSNAISEKSYMYNDVDEELQQLRQWQQQQQQEHQQLQPEHNYVDNTATSSSTPNTTNNTKLRELQIAYEFERVQSTMTSPEDVRSELESKFGIGTKYFLGTKEMEYALAVARVDYAIERRLRLGLSVDGEECIDFYDELDDVDEEGSDGNTSFRRNSEAMESCQDLPTPEELIAMEYDNLLRQTMWEEDALSEELESQYGIPAKHFMGKKEMAYALAVERVDRAMKEGGGYIMDDDDDDVLGEDEEDEDAETWEGDNFEDIVDDTSYYAVMTDEDMMKMMEEEMSKEREDEKSMDEPVQRRKREERRGNPSRSTTVIGGSGSVRGASSSSFGKVFKKEQPNPFILTKGPMTTPSTHLQTTPLAEMIQSNNKRERRPPPKRTPLSSEPPLGRQRLHQSQQQQQYQNRQTPLEMGTVIGEATIAQQRDSKSLADLLKGSEERQRIRSRAVMPPPRPSNVNGRPMSSPYDDSFRPLGGDRGSANTARVYDGAPDYGNNSAHSYGGVNRGSGSSGKRESKTRATQRPFEPAPFTEPGTHNAQGRASSASRQPGGFGGGPQRIPPQTPFTSPVTDGARRSSGSTSSSQGPFTPFTEPGKRSTNNMPPPRKRPSDPRRFNIKDTPETTQPFVTGSYVDYNTPYSPPLQVEPPPRDPRYQPISERPFEPAPYSNQGARVPGAGTNRGNNSPPYRQKEEKGQGYTSSSSPFDKWKDMFSSTKWGGEKKKAAENEEPKGFKSGNVEVFPSDTNDDGLRSPLNSVVGTPIDEIRQQAVVVEIIDAKQRIKSSRDVQDKDGEGIRDSRIPQTSAAFPSDAWKGGPSAAAAASTTSKTSSLPNTNNIASNDAMEKAKNLLASDPATRELVSKAQTNPKLREALIKCRDNPSAFGNYLNDADIGPILNELKQCILSRK